MKAHFLGCIEYATAEALMQLLHTQIVQDSSHPGTLLVLEHPPIITLGKRALQEDVLVHSRDITTHVTDRGGRATAHEPGQVVIYPLVPLRMYGHGVRSFVSALERAMKAVCANYGLQVQFDPKNPGVWLERQKIGAVGIRISQGVSYHGLAFNVLNSLTTFQNIVPCGLANSGVTSLHQALQHRTDNPILPTWLEVAQQLTNSVIQFIRKGPFDVPKENP